jgi:hypothetical protein
MQKRTDISQIFEIFHPKNCDQRVTEFCIEKSPNKKKKSPLGHFFRREWGETFLGLDPLNALFPNIPEKLFASGPKIY